MHVVIGSGLAGVTTAKALLDRGLKVTLLDVGREIKLGTPEGHAMFPARYPLASQGRFQKISPFEEFQVQFEASDYVLPFVQGGASNYWTASLMPADARDLVEWPSLSTKLDPHYREILSNIFFSASQDELEKNFPLYQDSPSELSASPQIEAFLSDLSKNSEALSQKGIKFGRSRLAVDDGLKTKESCTYCGACIMGCPSDLIYHAGHTLEQLKSRRGEFTFRPHFLVRRLEDAGSSVLIHGTDLSNKSLETLRVERVYLAAGVLPTTKILLESMGAYGKRITIQDNLYFNLPFKRFVGSPRIQKEQLYTLPQLFMEILDPTISNHWIHIEVSGYNQGLGAWLKSRLGPLQALTRRMVEGKLLVLRGFFHSQSSPKLSLWLRRDSRTDKSSLFVKGIDPHNYKDKVTKLIDKLRKEKGLLRGKPIERWLQIGLPGQSLNLAGSFPMRESPSVYESDFLGRPYGWSRVHLTDSTCFSSVPGTGLALPLMANAHRIASQSIEL